MSKSISSLFKKERSWANCSCWSFKIATVSESLSIYFRKSDISDLLMIGENHSQKNVFLVCFWLFSPFLCQKSESLMSIFTKERPWADRSRRCFKKSDGSDSIRWIFKKDRRENSHFSRKITKNVRFARKTDDRIPNPDYKVQSKDLKENDKGKKWWKCAWWQTICISLRWLSKKKIVAQVSKKRVKCSFKCNPLVAVIGQKKHSWRTI